MAFNPNAIFISPSSISDFKTCPQLYFYRNVYRNPRTGLKINIINPKLALGQAVHNALNNFVYSTNQQEKTKEKLLNLFELCWKQISGIKGGFSSESEESTYKERGIKMLDRFYNNKHFVTTIPIKISNFPKADLGDDIILTGKLDWIEKNGENSYHVVDFKTGENDERTDSLQLPIYALLSSAQVKSKSIKTSYWYLDRNDELSDWDITDIDEIRNNVKMKGEIIKNARLTNSFNCSSGFESCWACKGLVNVAKGKGKLVSTDLRQEIYILVDENNENDQNEDDLPF